MAAFPLTLLALAAGAFLLLRAKKEQMGKVFEWLAWLIIVLSTLFIIGLAFMGMRHHRMMRDRMMENRGMMMHQMGGWHGQGCCSYNQGMSCCQSMQGCRMNMGCGGMEGGGMNMGCGGKGRNSCCGEMDGHGMSGQCMADSTHAMGGKGACCMGDKKDEKKK